MDQQQQVGVNQGILDAISTLRRPRRYGERPHQHTLFIRTENNLDRQSVQYLVEFLRGDTHQVKELVLDAFNLLQPSDGGLDVLQDYFRTQTTLTTIMLYHCYFGGQEEALQLITAVQSNRLVTDLSICNISHLRDTVLGNCISGVLQTNVTLQRLELSDTLNAETVRALQPGLRSNRSLKIFNLSCCSLGDDGIRLIVDALVGNTTMEMLDLLGNSITKNGFVDIIRLVELTRLKKIDVRHNIRVFKDNNDIQHFTDVLHQHTSLEEFRGLDFRRFPVIRNLLARNVSINRASALLSLQPRTGLPIGSKSGIWYMAMSEMARSHEADRVDDDDEDEDGGDDDDSGNGVNAAPTYPGVSAIFKIFQARPAILEYQLPRSSAAASAIHLHERDSREKRRRIL